MFVEVTHSVQPPKKMLFRGCRSVCWLQVFDNSDGIRRDTNQEFVESSKAVTIPFLDNRELSMAGNCDGEFSQSPHKLVEGCAHAVEGIPASQANVVRNIIKVKPEDMPLIFKVILSAKSAGIRFVESEKFIVESLKVTLRPIQLQIGVRKSSSDHDLRG
jgi:hypothetical protein